MSSATEAYQIVAGYQVSDLNTLILGFLFAILCIAAAYIFKEQLKELRAGASFDDVLKTVLRVVILISLISVFLLQ